MRRSARQTTLARRAASFVMEAEARRDANVGLCVQPLLARAAAIVLRPRTTWTVIAGETHSPGSLLFRYVAPLAAIGPLAKYVTLRDIGVRLADGGTFHASRSAAIGESGLSFAFAISGAVLAAAVIDALAPCFGATRDFARAFRVAAYAFTPLWLAGLFVLVPPLVVLQLAAALYALILLSLGLRTVMRGTARRTWPYTAAVIAAVLASGYVTGVIVALAHDLLRAARL